MKSIKQRIIDSEINIYKDYLECYNELTEEDIDYIIKKDPWFAAENLNQHPFLTQKHVDYIVEIKPDRAAYCLSQHPLLTQEHVDYIVKSVPDRAAYCLNQHPYFKQKHVDIIVKEASYAAVEYLSYMLSEENISWIAENKPNLLKGVFK